jgi:hypothetical protein
MKMPKKLRDKWVKALRSGEYGQTKGILTNGKGGFCCLGVLQHVASGGSCEAYDDLAGEFMGSPTSKWYSDNGISEYSGDVSALITMNDKRRSKFTTIANWIEKNIEVY